MTSSQLTSEKTNSRAYTIGLVLIVLVASLLRLYRPSLYEFSGDEFFIHYLAAQLGQYGDWTFQGPLAGWAGPIPIHSPFSVYVNALGYAIFPVPESARFIIGILAIASIVLMMWTVRRYWGTTAALTTGIFLTVFPLMVEQGRYAWNPSVGLFFIAGWFSTALLGFHEGKRWAQILHWLALSFMIQSQSVLLYMIPATFALVGYHLWQTKKASVLVNAVIGILLFLVSNIPWFIGSYYAADAPAGGSSEFLLQIPAINDVFWQQLRMASSVDMYGAFRTMLNFSDDNWFPPDQLDWLYSVQGVFVIVTAGLLVVMGFREKEIRLPFWLFGLMFFYPQGINIVSIDKGIAAYYLFPMTFAAAGIFGIGIGALWANFPRWRIVVMPVVIVALLGQAWLSVGLLRWFDVDSRRAPDRLPLHVFNDAEATWRSASDNTVFLIEDNEYYNPIQQAWLWNALTINDRENFQTLVLPSGVPIPPDGTVLASAAPARTLNLFADPTDIQTYGTFLDSGAPIYTWTVITPDDLPMPNYTPQNTGDYQNGVTIRGLSASQSDTTWGAMLIWETPDIPANEYHFSLRLLDADGNRLAQSDTPSLSSVLWREGNTVANTFYLETAEPVRENDMVSFELVMYTYPDLATVETIAQAQSMRL
ncbi:MAG: glycosyltransferase family 39 protein, partial [Chloroflexota bacterium]